jgi:hypothetical protein
VRWITQAPGGKPVVEDHDPESSLWRRLGFRLLAPFAPEEML